MANVEFPDYMKGVSGTIRRYQTQNHRYLLQIRQAEVIYS